MVCACRGDGIGIARNGASCGGGVILVSGRAEWPPSGREPIPPAQDVPTAFWLTMHCAMAAGAVAMDRLAASARRIHVFMSVIFAPLDPLPIAIRAQCDVAPLAPTATQRFCRFPTPVSLELAPAAEEAVERREPAAKLPQELHDDLPHG
jgi:hypothetical protein